MVASLPRGIALSFRIQIYWFTVYIYDKSLYHHHHLIFLVRWMTTEMAEDFDREYYLSTTARESIIFTVFLINLSIGTIKKFKIFWRNLIFSEFSDKLLLEWYIRRCSSWRGYSSKSSLKHTLNQAEIKSNFPKYGVPVTFGRWAVNSDKFNSTNTYTL